MGLTGFQRRRRELAAEQPEAAPDAKSARRPRAPRAASAVAEQPEAAPVVSSDDRDSPQQEAAGAA